MIVMGCNVISMPLSVFGLFGDLVVWIPRPLLVSAGFDTNSRRSSMDVRHSFLSFASELGFWIPFSKKRKVSFTISEMEQQIFAQPLATKSRHFVASLPALGRSFVSTPKSSPEERLAGKLILAEVRSVNCILWLASVFKTFSKGRTAFWGLEGN